MMSAITLELEYMEDGNLIQRNHHLFYNRDLYEYFCNTDIKDIKLRDLKEGEIYQIGRKDIVGVNYKPNKYKYYDYYYKRSRFQEDLNFKDLSYGKAYLDDSPIQLPDQISVDKKVVVSSNNYWRSETREVFTNKLVSTNEYVYNNRGYLIYESQQISGEKKFEAYRFNNNNTVLEFIDGKCYSMIKYENNIFEVPSYFILIDKNEEIIQKFSSFGTCDVWIDIVNI